MQYVTPTAQLSHAPSRYFIGLMSGTSLDGVDAVLMQYQQPDGQEQWQQIAQAFVAYPNQIKQDLLALHTPAQHELHTAAVMGNRLAALYAQAVHAVLANGQLAASQISAIGCHGQTVRHCPDLGDGEAYTLQLGNHAKLAELTGISVVGDFRSRDIAAGGQGAPLVPAFHQSVFASGQTHRVIINIGGIANLTDLPRDGKVTGFDSGPGNLLMDAWTLEHTGQAYDASGSWAAQGSVHLPLLHAMLAEPYLQLPPPKSTGRDLFNRQWLQQHLEAVVRDAGETAAVPPVNVARTLLEYTAKTIADALQRDCAGAQEVYVCGGGAHNDMLVSRLQSLCGLPLQATDSLGIGADWVEAVAFAWLAQRCVDGLSGNLPAVTGARGPRILGAIYPA